MMIVNLFSAVVLAFLAVVKLARGDIADRDRVVA
jgi:hypothetical protein